MVFEGHTGPVNSLFQVQEGELISGSWDGTARIWDTATGETKHVLEGHSHGVAVYGFENGIILTGSADKKIRIWFKGNLEKEFEAHDQAVRGFCEVPGIGFASCSNDETVKLWTLDGVSIGILTGHSGFVYHVTTLLSGELVSCCDDKSVRIWNRDGQCQQIINLPGSVFCAV